jgi:tetratricopeptide (TPR) repeat protein
MKIISNIIIVITSFVIIFSCGNSTSTEKSAEDYAAEGWELFLKHDYEAAEISFLTAIKEDANLADAYSGAGWAISYQEGRLSEAVLQWEEGVSKEAVNADLYAGLTIAYHALDSFDNCVDAGNQVAAFDANYVFEYNNNITISMIHGILAAAHYGLTDYVSAASEMDLAVPTAAPHSSDDLNELLTSIMDFLGLN